MATSENMDRIVATGLKSYNDTTKQTIVHLFEDQIYALDSIRNKHDTLVVLPTGKGKSLIYELVPFVMDSTYICIVIVPLNAIIEQQMDKLDKCCIKIVNFSKKSLTKKTIYIIGHPEDFLESTNKLRELSDHPVKFCIVVDECHCILEWGPEFRPQYKNIHKIRTLLGGSKNCITVALTATATEDAQKLIIKELRMKNVTSIVRSPIRDNITLSVKPREPSEGSESYIERTYEHALTETFSQLNNMLDNYPVTVIYINNFHWCGYAYELGRTILKDNFYKGEISNGNERVQQYHAHLSDETKGHVIALLKDAKSPLRILIATSALGMGADIKHIDQIVHLSPPSSLEAYVQQIGRAGRGGQQANALLYFITADLSKEYFSQSIRQYSQNTSMCRRQAIAKAFGSKLNEETAISCCDECKVILEKRQDRSQKNLVEKEHKNNLVSTIDPLGLLFDM